MHLRMAKGASGGTQQGHTFHFPPMTTPVRAVQVVSGAYTAPCGDGLDGGNLSNDLKVHDVSASSASALQMYDTYASVIIPHVPRKEAEQVILSLLYNSPM